MAFWGPEFCPPALRVESMHALWEAENSLFGNCVLSVLCGWKRFLTPLWEEYLLINTGFEVKQISKPKFPVKKNNKENNITLSLNITSLYHLTTNHTQSKFGFFALKFI